jgi:hypothetical protein
MNEVWFWGLTGTDLLALLGAVTGVLALILDGVRFLRSGPRLRLKLAPNMQQLTLAGGLSEDLCFVVTLINVGDLETKVTDIGFRLIGPRRWWIFPGAKGHKVMFVPGLPVKVPPGGDRELKIPQETIREAVRGAASAKIEVGHTVGSPIRAPIPLGRLK